MPRWRQAVTVGLAGVMLVTAAKQLHAQTFRGPDEAPMQLGPLALAPGIRVTNFGYDSNVFSQNEAADPVEDVSATATPSVTAWLRLPSANLTGTAEFDFIYFNELSHLRTVDTDNSVGFEVFLARLRPYAFGRFANTRHRPTLEIDFPAQRADASGEAGVELWLSGKTTVQVYAIASRLEYEEGIVELESSLARRLNRRSSGAGLRVRYNLTPLTTVSIEAERRHDRFEFVPERDTEQLRVGPILEFKPVAVLRGRVALGLNRNTSVQGGTAKAGGTFIYADLGYTLMGRTRFQIEVQRDISHSFWIQAEQYQHTGFNASIVHRLVHPWELRGRVGRYRLTYFADDGGSGVLAPADGLDRREQLMRYDVGLGYRLGKTRLGVDLRYSGRESDVAPRREYSRVQVVSSVTYAF